ncbi:MAG: 3-dehydroquinate synthase [Paramuribaculum sp.]|nr:3-dehydroquinate synthase [Paramuribaculum sp.]MDE5921095.1 3-dehydroquinate synthase [Paramuribaculum sp.]
MSQILVFNNEVAAAIEAIVDEAKPNGLFVITDSNVRREVLPALAEQSAAVAGACVIECEPGDEAKNLSSLSEIWSRLVAGGCSRSSLIINIGGGVVTDMGGFAAATFKRGVKFINVPTTLLAAVDAAVGGKTGINFEGLKNEIGVFQEAVAVIISTCFFRSLPREELLSGYAEMLKHGLLDSEEAIDRLLAFPIEDCDDPKELLQLLKKSVTVKQRIVEEDPHERGLRKALNLGHTMAHAMEGLAMKTGAHLAHGYAVARGLVADLVLSHMKHGFPSERLHSVAQFVKSRYGAPEFTCDDYDTLIGLMRHDKKNTDPQTINFTLLAAPGDIRLDSTATPEEIAAALDITRDLLGA